VVSITKCGFCGSDIVGELCGICGRNHAENNELIVAIAKLMRVANALDERDTEKTMKNVMENIESQFSIDTSPEVEYWLGVAWENFTGWYVRGDERKIYLDRSIKHYEKAYSLSRDYSHGRWVEYAGNLGRLLVDTAIIRDLEKAIPILEDIYNNTDEYLPPLCSLPEAYYKKGNFLKAADIGKELYKRAIEEAKREAKNLGISEWDDFVPYAPLETASKAYRALVRQYRKERNIENAYNTSCKLIELGYYSDNDEKIHKKLESENEISGRV
jgi:hypothetical protein